MGTPFNTSPDFIPSPTFLQNLKKEVCTNKTNYKSSLILYGSIINRNIHYGGGKGLVILRPSSYNILTTVLYNRSCDRTSLPNTLNSINTTQDLRTHEFLENRLLLTFHLN